MESRISEIGEIVDDIVKKGLNDNSEEEQKTDGIKNSSKVEEETKSTNEKGLEIQTENEPELTNNEDNPLISHERETCCKHESENWKAGFDPSKDYKKKITCFIYI